MKMHYVIPSRITKSNIQQIENFFLGVGIANKIGLSSEILCLCVSVDSKPFVPLMYKYGHWFLYPIWGLVDMTHCMDLNRQPKGRGTSGLLGPLALPLI